MKTNKEKKSLDHRQLEVKHNQVIYFLIGLAGAFVFLGLLMVVLWVNNLVTQFTPLFIFVSLAFLFMFTTMDATLMAVLLQYHYGKY